MNCLEDPDRRAILGQIADVLIPADDGMPSATDVGTHGGLIDQALNYRPDLAEAFGRALDLVANADPAAAVARLADHNPEEFFALSLLTTGAYYVSPTVRQLLNYHQGQPRPAHDDVETYVDMLEAVVERGPIYRVVPG